MTLEFIGTSGVGKTTLFRETMGKLTKRWFFAYQLDLVKRKTPASEIDGVLMEILKNRIEKITTSDSYCPWHSFLDLKLSVRVMHETMVVAHSSHPQGFTFDEGLFRHFPAEILQIGDEFPAQLWHNRAFVYLRARTPETALARVRSRTEMLAQIERQRERSDEQRLTNILRDQEVFQAIVDKAKTFGCPVLVLDAEDPFADSVNKVIEFESTLGQRFKKQEKTDTNTHSQSIEQ
jgi:thymidylate kinase